MMSFILRVGTCALALGVGLLGSRRAMAQNATHNSTLDTALLLAPHRVAADTGRMAWGHINFSRYTNAVPCDRAVRNMAEEMWRIDPLVGAGHDSLPLQAVTVARVCGDRADVTNSPMLSVVSFLKLSLAAGRDDRAAETIERSLAAIPTVSVRAEAVLSAIQIYLSASPARRVPAYALLRQLDTIGVKTSSSASAASTTPASQAAVLRTIRYLACLTFAQYYTKQSYNIDSMAAYATAATVALKAMPKEEREQLSPDALLGPYQLLFNVANDRGNIADQQRLLREGAAVLGMNGYHFLQGMKKLMTVRAALYGTRVSSLTSADWFRSDSSVHPSVGKPTLLVWLDPTCEWRTCVSTYTVIRDLLAHYGTSVDLTTVTHTVGYVPWKGPMSPDDEGRERVRYYRDIWGVQSSMLIARRPVTHRTDGVVEYGTTSATDLFQGWTAGNAVLIDAAGIVRWIGAIGDVRDRKKIESVIDRLGSTATPTTP